MEPSMEIEMDTDLTCPACKDRIEVLVRTTVTNSSARISGGDHWHNDVGVSIEAQATGILIHHECKIEVD